MSNMKAEELHSNLAQFSGSECVYQFKLAANLPALMLKGTEWGDLTITYTEGVKYLIENAECYWLIMDIATLLPKVQKKKSDWLRLHFWVLEKGEGSKATLKCVHDTDKRSMDNPVVKKEYDFTDFPFPTDGKFVLYCGATFANFGKIQNIMLRSEY